MIEFENVSFSYDKSSRKLLDNFSYIFNNHGFYLIKGKSGCGKSTFLKLISGIIKPTFGTIKFNNIILNDLSNDALSDFINNNIGFIDQDINLINDYNVVENILMGPESRGIKVSKTDADLKNIINSVELNSINFKQKVRDLSGGQKQRIVIARTLLKNSKVILCDEPTGSLDKKNSENIYSILKNISRKKLVIVVSHDLDCEKFADFIFDFEKMKTTDYNLESTFCDNNIIENDHKKQLGGLKFLSHLFNSNFKKNIIFSLVSCISMAGSIIGSSFLLDNGTLNIVETMKSNNEYAFEICKENVEETNSGIKNGISDYFFGDEIENLLDENKISNYSTGSDCLKNYFFSNLNIDDELSDFLYNSFSYTINAVTFDFDAYRLSYTGKIPSSDDEIMISDYFYQIINRFGFKEIIDDDTQLISVINDENELLNKSIIFSNGEKDINFKITGIVHTNIDLDYIINDYTKNKDNLSELEYLDKILTYGFKRCVFVNSTEFFELNEGTDYIARVYVPLMNNINNRKLLKLLKQEYNKTEKYYGYDYVSYKCCSISFEKFDSLYYTSSTINIIISIVGIILIILMLLFSYIYSNLLFNKEKFDIAIYLSLGYKKKFITTYTLGYIFLYSLINFIISIFLSYLIKLVSSMLSINIFGVNVTLFTVNYGSVFLILVVFLVNFLISFYTNLRKLSVTSAAEYLKREL